MNQLFEPVRERNDILNTKKTIKLTFSGVEYKYLTDWKSDGTPFWNPFCKYDPMAFTNGSPRKM